MVVQEYPTVIVANQEYLKAAGKVRNLTEGPKKLRKNIEKWPN